MTELEQGDHTLLEVIDAIRTLPKADPEICKRAILRALETPSPEVVEAMLAAHLGAVESGHRPAIVAAWRAGIAARIKSGGDNVKP